MDGYLKTSMGKVKELEQTTTQDISAYSEHDQISHVLNIPDTYLGSDEAITTQEYLLDYNKMSMHSGDIKISQAMVRTFIEILSNAGDNVFRTMDVKNVDLGEIKVWYKDNEISVRNNGLCIPIQKKDGESVYVSENIFGKLLTSSNYDKNIPRMGCGRNGYGAKLTNIYSTSFTGCIQNVDQKKQSTQTWTNNMRDKGEHVISKYTGKTSSVTITYILDFKRFGMNKYPKYTDNLFARYVGDFALSCKIPVYFNDIRIPFDDIEN